MQTYVAEVGEIVRAHRRDEEEIQQLAERFNNVIRELVDQRLWIRIHPYLNTISKGVYYSATLLSGVTTLGEEYLNVYESDGLTRMAPSFLNRALFVSLHVFIPLLSDRLLLSAEHSLNHPSTNSFMGLPIENNEKARESCIAIVRWIRTTLVANLRRIHLALFYLNGAYYNISRRLAGIRYISFSPQTDTKALKVYRFLGYVTLLQCAVSVLMCLSKWRETELKGSENKKESEQGQTSAQSDVLDEEELVRSSFRCAVCLERRLPACAPCGHIFCWYCIQEHAHNNQSGESPRCPQCRKEYEPREVVPLLNL